MVVLNSQSTVPEVGMIVLNSQYTYSGGSGRGSADCKIHSANQTNVS